MTEKFKELTSAIDRQLQRMKYSSHTLNEYHRFWKSVDEYMNNHNINEFNHEIAESYFCETYGYSLSAPADLFTSYTRSCRRALSVLLEYQKSGVIYRRKPQKDHVFQECYQPAIGNFMEIVRQTLARTTCRQIQSRMEIFLGFLFEKGCTNISLITKGIILDFWKTRENISKTTQENDAYVLRKFFDFLYENGYTMVDNSVFVPNVIGNHKGKLPSYYTTDEITKLLSNIDRSNPTGRRDYAMLLLAVRYGMRIGDIRSLKLSDIHWKDSCISFVQNKTGKKINFPLLDDVATALIEYFQNGRPKTECPNVFVRHCAPFDEFGKDNNFYNIIEKYMRISGLSAVNCRKQGFHVLRHSIAGNMLNLGIPLSTVSEVLGHGSSETTMIYTKIGIKQLESCALEVE